MASAQEAPFADFLQGAYRQHEDHPSEYASTAEEPAAMAAATTDWRQAMIDFEKGMLPLGSVVVLKGGNVPLMVYGRLQRQASDPKSRLWDYVGVVDPYGHTDDDHTYLFDHEQVERLLFVGYISPAEEEMQAKIEEYRAAHATECGPGGAPASGSAAGGEKR